MILAIALSAVACSTEDAATNNQSIAKTDVAFLLRNPSSSSETGKSIKQNDIPASVAVVKLKAVHSSGYEVKDQWNVVPNNTVGAEDNFILKDVGVGNNTFYLTTETTAKKQFELVGVNGNPETVITNLKKNVPYALYDAVLSKLMAQTGNLVNINATTPHGRLLTVFQLEDNGTYFEKLTNKNEKFAATIKAEVKDASGKVLATNNGPKINGSGLASFEWSNELSVAGNKVVYTIEVVPYPNNNDNLKTTYTIEQAIKASTSISCIYTVGKDKAPKQTIDESKIVFAWQKWVEENCPDYPNCK